MICSARDLLQLHEGLRLAAYRCPAGRLTIGWGTNVEARPVSGVRCEGDAISREQADALLDAEIDRLVTGIARRLPWSRELDPVRQAVLIDMAYNLGLSGLLKFGRTLGLVRLGRYAEAAAAMRESKWHGQVGTRAARLEQMMESGRWPEGVKP